MPTIKSIAAATVAVVGATLAIVPLGPDSPGDRSVEVAHSMAKHGASEAQMASQMSSLGESKALESMKGKSRRDPRTIHSEVVAMATPVSEHAASETLVATAYCEPLPESMRAKCESDQSGFLGESFCSKTGTETLRAARLRATPAESARLQSAAATDGARGLTFLAGAESDSAYFGWLSSVAGGPVSRCED